MELFNIIAILFTLSAVFSYINYRYLKIQMTIGLVLISLLMSVCMILIDKAGFHLDLSDMLASIDFNETVLVGLLAFLLFAGALHVDINDLIDHWFAIGIFATAGVVVSAVIIGSVMHYAFESLHVSVSYLYCLLFGALISPTDPIAVLGILKSSNAPKELEIRIAGESLFNDGVGVVVFIVLLSLLSGGHDISVSGIGFLFAKEVVGGILVGLGIGWIGYIMLKKVDQYQVEILITLALVTSSYALSLNLHLSGPIAVVVIGLMIGNNGRKFAMTEKTRQHLDMFWELIDEILNAILFVLIGLEVLVISVTMKNLMFGLMAIPVSLIARFLSIAAPVMLLGKWMGAGPKTIRIMTWGGLRGGISVALALSLPAGMEKDVILTMTYMVVVFSLVVQGLTLKHVV